jgi:uncharacterized protein (DUF305 family)
MSTLLEVPEIDDDDVVVLPWWHNPLNIIAIVVAAAVLAGALGFVLGDRNATPKSSSVDIGFLHDMRTHHEQAVEMSLIYISKPNTDPALRTIAKTIAFGQGIDIGRMIQLLRGFGATEANETGTAMAWMNEPLPEERMPGMASGSDQEALLTATGATADQVFAKLMIAHHQGGIHMADHAALHAKNAEVRQMAADMSKSQADEIAEIQGVAPNG